MAEKIARESQIKRFKENCDLTYQGKVEGKSLVDDNEIRKLNGVESGAQLNKIESITLNGQDVPVEQKVAKINIDEIVGGQLVDYIDQDELQSKLEEALRPYVKTESLTSTLEPYAKNDDVTNAVKDVYRVKGDKDTLGDIQAVEEKTIGDTYNDLSSGMNYTWNGKSWDALGSEKTDLSSIEQKLASKVDNDQLTKDKQEIETKLGQKADQDKLDELTASLDGYLKKEELEGVTGLNGFTVYDDSEIAALFNGTDTVQVDKTQVEITSSGSDVVNVTSGNAETVTTEILEDYQSFFETEVQEMAITVRGKAQGSGNFVVKADGLRDAVVNVTVTGEGS